MTDTQLDDSVGRTGAMRKLVAVIALGIGPAVSTGCVTVNAPEKPIEINLNINITQEVVYRLDQDAKNLIQEHPGIF